jgi:hypothetical protein
METLLEAYFDESGTHSDARVFVVSGYLAPAEKWEKFAYESANMLSEANLTHWHQVDFAQRVRGYSGWTEEKRVKFMQRAVGIIKNTVNAGVSCGVNAMAFKELALIRQKLSTVSNERGRRDRKPWAPERTVCSKALTYETSPLGECGVAFKAVSHCPRL